MIEFKNVYAGYGNSEILHGLSVRFGKGKITGIIGTNGCGKSTLLKTIVGMVDRTSGDILVDGKDIKEYKGSDLAKKVAYLPQSKAVPDMSVIQMVLHGRFPYLSYPRRYKKEDVEIALKSMDIMAILDFKDKFVADLSGGQRQKAYIAMALAQKSPVILMDEPTTYLDISQQFKLCDTIKNLAEMGKTVVIVLHDLELAMKICDIICLMHEGQVITNDSPCEIMKTNIIKNAFGIDVKAIDIDGRLQYYYEL